MNDLIEWLHEFFSKNNKALGNKADLFDGGHIDSMGLIELITAIESNFDIELTSENLEDPRFRTIQGIAQIIHESKTSRS